MSSEAGTSLTIYQRIPTPVGVTAIFKVFFTAFRGPLSFSIKASDELENTHNNSSDHWRTVIYRQGRVIAALEGNQEAQLE
ncbi:MAG: hypothetical protein H7Y27_09360 [Gemmatimonadaceae bacterium]|nr:hypothetical protein [Chitinophagaceae bacterium]